MKQVRKWALDYALDQPDTFHRDIDAAMEAAYIDGFEKCQEETLKLSSVERMEGGTAEVIFAVDVKRLGKEEVE